jgi:hypothetical protein
VGKDRLEAVFAAREADSTAKPRKNGSVFYGSADQETFK